MLVRGLGESLHDAIEVKIPALALALYVHTVPGGLFGRINTPDDDIAPTAPVVMPGGVPGAVAFLICGEAEETLEGGF